MTIEILYNHRDALNHRYVVYNIDETTSTPRRRSLRRSLRESFRHLRKRRIPIRSFLQRRGRTESKTEPATEGETAKPEEEGKTEQAASASAPAATASV